MVSHLRGLTGGISGVAADLHDLLRDDVPGGEYGYLHLLQGSERSWMQLILSHKVSGIDKSSSLFVRHGAGLGEDGELTGCNAIRRKGT